MSALSIQPTFPIFTETDGQPLENGYIWIGTVNLDPQVNPINVYWDAALTISAPQPIRTLGGYPSRNGTPARLYVNSDYSIRVMNKNGSAVYSAPEATERLSSSLVSFIQAGAGAISRTSQDKMREIVSVLDFGADPTGAFDSTLEIQAALDYAAANNKKVFVPGGSYLISSITFPSFDCYLEGEGRDLVTFTTSTTGNAITVGRARSGISGIKLVQSNAGTGKGIVGPSDGCDWFQCRDLQTFGFDYGLYMQKSVYHDYRECEFGDGNTGAEFIVGTGIPNGNWFNNAHSFIDCKFHRHVNNGINWGGICATFINCDASSCDVGFYIHGTSDANNEQAFAASFTGCYVERTDVPFWFNDAKGTIDQCFMAGADNFSPSGAGYYTAPVRATGIRTEVEIGVCKVWGYWLYKALIDNAATLVYSIDGLKEVVAYNSTYGTGTIRQTVFAKQLQIDGLVSLPDTRVSVNSPQPATLASRIETDAFGSNVNAEYLIRKDSTGTNRTSEPPVLVLVNDATPTANQMIRLAFGASAPGLPQNFNGTISADIRVVFPTTGANGRSSRIVLGTTDESVSGSPIDRVAVKEDGDFDPVANNAYDLGDASFVWSNIYSQNAVTVVSDARTKTNVEDSSLGLGFVNALRPVSYKSITGGIEVVEVQNEDGTFKHVEVVRPGQRTHWGLIAQEVKQAIETAGVDFGGWVLSDKDDPDSKQALRYEQFIAPLIKAVQELSAKVSELEKRIA